MKIASVSMAKNELSALLRRVRRGESVLICDRGKPVARLVPVRAGPEEGDDAERLERLERAGLVRRGEPGADDVDDGGPDLLDEAPPALVPGKSALATLLAEREEGP
jgi:prevent-host-death family protein